MDKDNKIMTESSERVEKVDNSYQNMKMIRRMRGITLKQLAKASNLSISFLSNYENGRVNITIASLKKIALALGVPVSDLITDNEADDIIFVPREKRYIHTLYESPTGKAVHEYLTRSNDVCMHVVIGRLPPHSDTGEPSSHNGEEFILAIKGIVSVILDGVVYRIKDGDMLYYRSTLFHKLANEQDEEVEYLQVNTPPTY